MQTVYRLPEQTVPEHIHGDGRANLFLVKVYNQLSVLELPGIWFLLTNFQKEAVTQLQMRRSLRLRMDMPNYPKMFSCPYIDVLHRYVRKPQVHEWLR